MRWTLIFVLSLSAYATTRNAATCSSTDVQTQITASSNGDTVVVPSGSCTYTTSLNSNVFITLQGTNTNITLSGVDFIGFDYHNLNAFPIRVTGFNFSGANNAYAIQIQGKPLSYHLDHLTFTNLAHRAIFIGGQNDSNPPCYPIYGAMDHITWTQSNTIPGIQMTGCNEAWKSPTDMGTINANFIEDSTFTYTGGNYVSSAAAIDCEHGCKFVFRHNVINQTWVSTHDTGSTPQSRGVRQKEIYANTFTCAGGCGPAMDLRGGTGLIYDNSVAVDLSGGSIGFNPPILTEIYRNNFTGGVPWDFMSGLESHRVGDLTYESMRLYCSTDQSVCYSVVAVCGGGTCQKSCTADADLGANGKCLTRFDGAGAGGYPVRDQTGVSADANDAASTQTAAGDPVYIWNNTDPNTSNALITSPVSVASVDTTYIVNNREFYTQPTSFTGATGVGRGTLAARPATCTTGVGYWETNNLRLDKCTATNTWTNGVYTPFTYPHPLQGSGPVAMFAPISLAFANQVLGTTSNTQNLSLSNTGSSLMSIASIAVGGVNSTDFSQTNTCSATLAVSASCTISVAFSPTSVGSRIGAIIVTSDASNSPTSAGLSGSGIQAFSPISGVVFTGGVTIH